MISLLMGDKVEPGEYIAKHADFSRQDDFDEKRPTAQPAPLSKEIVWPARHPNHRT